MSKEIGNENFDADFEALFGIKPDPAGLEAADHRDRRAGDPTVNKPPRVLGTIGDALRRARQLHRMFGPQLQIKEFLSSN